VCVVTGRVFAHVGHAFHERAYDFVVVGGGRMGVAAAFYLRRLQPDASVLIVERDGIPSEAGATLNARAVWGAASLPPAWVPRARWVRRVWMDPEAETGTARPHDPPFRSVGWAHLLGPDDAAPGRADADALEELRTAAFLDRLGDEGRRFLASLVDVSGVARVVLDAEGGYGSASTLALAYGYGAVRLGADLLLNAEAHLTPGGVEVRRLDITRSMEIVVAQTVRVRAGHVIVAAGHESMSLLESSLGVVRPHRRAFVQFPQLRQAPPERFPVLSRAGFTVRPGVAGLRVLPPVHAPDPAGYEPTGGQLLGVRVGARRELLEEFLSVMDAWPAFAGGDLNLGRTVLDVPGGWEARPAGGWPLWERVTDGVTLLLGGPEADRVGVAVALDAAASLSGVLERPWDSPET